jgi:hypothetical protein
MHQRQFWGWLPLCFVIIHDFGKSHKNQTRPLSVINMNRKLTIAFALLALLALSVVGQSFAQTRVPGVTAGDTFNYTLTSYWNSDNASSTIPSDLLELNKTKSYDISVTSVIDTNVTTNDFWRFTVNDTENPSLVIQNVESGSSYYMGGLIGIVGANMSAGDLLHPLATDGWMINQTISRNYGSGNRETNVITFIDSVLDENNNTIGSKNETYSFDKQTGVLVERREDLVQYGDRAIIVLLLTETNRWTVQDSDWAILRIFRESLGDSYLLIIVGIIAAVIVAVVVAVVYFRRRKNPKKGFRR